MTQGHCWWLLLWQLGCLWSLCQVSCFRARDQRTLLLRWHPLTLAHLHAGPCAALAALVASGLPTDAFHFAGFLPAKGAQRRTRLGNVSGAFPWFRGAEAKVLHDTRLDK